MKLFSKVLVLILVAVCAGGLNYEANDGDNVNISFKTVGLERAEQVTITLTRGSQKDVIARYCRCEDCTVVKRPGVMLRVEEGTLTLLNVSSRDSGLYEAKIIAGNILSKKNATLHVNKAVLSSSEETPQSISKPPDSSERQRLYVLIAPVVFISVVLGVAFICKCV